MDCVRKHFFTGKSGLFFFFFEIIHVHFLHKVKRNGMLREDPTVL